MIDEPDDWKTLTNLITPGNLLNFGDPDYHILASYLGLLPEYLRGPAQKENDHDKVLSNFTLIVIYKLIQKSNVLLL